MQTMNPFNKTADGRMSDLRFQIVWKDTGETFNPMWQPGRDYKALLPFLANVQIEAGLGEAAHLCGKLDIGVVYGQPGREQ